MNLNDPFNRLNRQQESEYRAFRDSLKQSSINSQSKAEDLLRNIRRRALFIIGTIAIIGLIISIFKPELTIILLVLGSVISLWFLANTFKGYKFIRRYIQDEFSDQAVKE